VVKAISLRCNSEALKNRCQQLNVVFLTKLVGVYPNLITLYLVYNQISQQKEANNDRIKAIPGATAPRR